ncbi:hypothetical protein [Umezawaea sp.]|uniref:hypothetical protein n=1 Tax=Umezawaea sp. TaxID=1955258 RepID=UPI002ED2ABDE
MLKPMLVAVFLTGLFTPTATAAAAPTCLEPPTSDKNELCVEVLSLTDKDFYASGRFLSATPTATAWLTVSVQQRRDQWPEPITMAEKTTSGTGELTAVSGTGRIGPDTRAVRACAAGWTLVSARRYEVCTPWQGV